MDDFKRELIASAVKVAPPTGVSMWMMVEGHIDDWIKLATLLYIVVQVTAVIVGKYLLWTGRIGKRGDSNDD